MPSPSRLCDLTDDELVDEIDECMVMANDYNDVDRAGFYSEAILYQLERILRALTKGGK